ncbi:MAG: hypothetical protein PHR77_22080 [Kiritimatiellae bacterium]|nr:hypothetical protein [Kiritimatiellia bacterium]MDD5523455.1 hypothetical protein [Kiritimatiellia bacterium]
MKNNERCSLSEVAWVFVFCFCIGCSLHRCLCPEKFSRVKYVQARSIAGDLHVEIPTDLEQFFTAANSGDWVIASNIYERLISSSVMSGSTGIINSVTTKNPVWHTVQEVYGFYLETLRWAPSLLAQFCHDVYSSLPRKSVYFSSYEKDRYILLAFDKLEGKKQLSILSQSLLIDNTYLDYLRSVSDGCLLLPNTNDMVSVIMQSVKTRNGFQFQDGHVSLRNQETVIMVNGALSRMIFDRNKDAHDFFVESPMFDWMYPFLVPHGLIMKLERQPLKELPEDVVDKDIEFWDKYIEHLEKDVEWHKCLIARNVIAKKRSSYGEVYFYRGMKNKSEKAFRQALMISPVSPDANFGLARLYMKNGQSNACVKLLKQYEDRGGSKKQINDFLNKINNFIYIVKRAKELESELAGGKGAIDSILELADTYKKLGKLDKFEFVINQILDNSETHSETYLRIARMCENSDLMDIVIRAYKAYLNKVPTNKLAWMNLVAAYYLAMKDDQIADTLKQAIKINGTEMIDLLKQDGRFVQFLGKDAER